MPEEWHPEEQYLEELGAAPIVVNNDKGRAALNEVVVISN